MTAVLENLQSVRTKLEKLQMLLDELRGEYVNGIGGPEDYERAALLLDELTDGHQLNSYEERILIELEDAIQAYESQSEQFRAFNTAIKARTNPVQLLRDLMETLKLTGSDLPEIGDKTVVSKVLNGERQISHKMAFALADRFSMNPKAFVHSPESDFDGVLFEEANGVLIVTHKDDILATWDAVPSRLAPLGKPSARLFPHSHLHYSPASSVHGVSEPKSLISKVVVLNK